MPAFSISESFFRLRIIPLLLLLCILSACSKQVLGDALSGTTRGPIELYDVHGTLARVFYS